MACAQLIMIQGRKNHNKRLMQFFKNYKEAMITPGWIRKEN